MIIENYKKICKFCDQILLSKGSSIYTHSITALHILKEHPALLSYYFKNTNFEKNINVSVIKKIFNFLYNLLFEKKNFQYKSKKKNTCDILLLSSLINKLHLNKSDDFYYGDIQKKLNLRGYKTKIVLRNFTESKTSHLLKYISKDEILLSKSTNLFFELKIILILIYQYFFIKKFKLPEISNLNKNFLSLLSLRSMAVNLRL